MKMHKNFGMTSAAAPKLNSDLKVLEKLNTGNFSLIFPGCISLFSFLHQWTSTWESNVVQMIWLVLYLSVIIGYCCI